MEIEETIFFYEMNFNFSYFNIFTWGFKLVLKGERDKKRPATDKLWDCTPKIEGLSASETLQSVP